MKNVLFCLLAFIAFFPESFATVYHVKQNGSDSNNGLSWAAAFQSIQKAINTASVGDEVWVAGGTYFPTVQYGGTSSRNQTILIEKDIKLYGGFPTTGDPGLTERDWLSNPVILSGELGAAGNADNAFHVVLIQKVSNAMLLDGFTITGGNANGTLVEEMGGGIVNVGYTQNSKPLIHNCIITANTGKKGGGIASVGGLGGQSAPTFQDCTVSDNVSTLVGGGMYNTATMGASAPVFTNCSFSGNQAQALGGGIYADAYGAIGFCTLTLTYCTITNNHSNNGGGMYITSNDGNCLLNVSDCTFSSNDGGFGGALVIQAGSSNSIIASVFSRCLFADNTSLQGGAFYGGGLNFINYSVSFQNCIFNHNKGTSYGGAIGYTGGGLDITNCTFYNNTAATGGAFYVSTENYIGPNQIIANIKNCIEFGNSSGFVVPSNFTLPHINISNTLCQSSSCGYGWICGAGMLYNQDPQFENAAAGDFHLKTCSPAVNKGTATGAPGTDYAGSARPYDGSYDLGAYELQTLQFQAVCKSITAPLGASGSVTVPANSLDGGSIACSALSFSVNNQPSVTYNCTQLGNKSVTLQVSDATGHSGTCAVKITVVDQLPPTMLCKNATINLDASGNATLTTAQINNGSYDNCSISTLSASRTAFSCSNIGPNSVILSGTDASGNSAQCTAVVTVKDVIPPVALCKNATVQLNAAGQAPLAAALVNNGSSDICGITLALTPATLNCSNVGINNVVLRVMDPGGNVSTCNAVVTVQDNTAPAALCKNITVFLDDLGHASISTQSVDNGSYDNCTIASKTININQFNCSNIGGSPVSVMMTVKDVNNNTSSCLSNVTVKDNLAPTAICQNTTVHLGANGLVTVYPANLAANSFDNCSVWSYSPAAKVYNATNLGNNNLTITVKDYSNNPASCVSVVTVLPFTGAKGSEDREEEQPAATSNFDLKLYPNPTSGVSTLEFELPEAQEYSLSVFDLTGKTLFNETATGQAGVNQLPVELNGAAPGIYIVELQSQQLNARKRLILARN